jgi:NAD-dependent dihydropyrimidine dehydrogenase PreA subunit
MKRQIIKIDEEKCNGCGLCIPDCPEGALQIIDGKARLISDLFCDGLGACIGSCPEGAIATIEREAEPYDEVKVMENIIELGPNTINAHLEYFEQAVYLLNKKGISVPEIEIEFPCSVSGCPGLASQEIEPSEHLNSQSVPLRSELRQWPIQLHLINPNAPYLENADLLISADCVPFSFADFHQLFLKDKIVITLCPKLDKDIDLYIEKLAQIFRTKNIKSITVTRMEVPCCGGIELIIQKALEMAGKSTNVKVHIISIKGEIAREAS